MLGGAFYAWEVNWVKRRGIAQPLLFFFFSHYTKRLGSNQETVRDLVRARRAKRD